MAEGYAGRLGVVTGAGSGIGEGLARRLAVAGAAVVVADIDATRAEQVADEIVSSGGTAYARAMDVADAEAVERLAEGLFAEHGHVDLLINNAGLESAGMIWEVDAARWDRVMQVNLGGIFHGVRSFVPRMLATGRPATVVNLSSVGGVAIAPFQSPYIVSKHAVLALTECLRQELELVGAAIQVSVVLPSYVRSRIFSDAQAAAPSGNPLADAYFTGMERAGEQSALDPEEAAERILAGVTDGDFWVFTDAEAGQRVLAARAAQLVDRLPPADPRPRLREMGLSW